MSMHSEDEIFTTLREALDLEIDSIDAVDLIDHLKRQSGRRIAVEDFKTVRTVGDVVAAVQRMQSAPEP